MSVLRCHSPEQGKDDLTCKYIHQIYREDRGREFDGRKLEQLHQKYLLAETVKGDLQLSLQTTQNKLKQLEMK